MVQTATDQGEENNHSYEANVDSHKKLSTHSAPKHLVQKFSEYNVPPTEIM